MPRSGAENIPHVAWTDHRISEFPALASPSGILQKTTHWFRYFLHTQRNAIWPLPITVRFLKGILPLSKKAYQILKEIWPEILVDKEALNALGILSEKRGDYKQATEIFEQVLKMIGKTSGTVEPWHAAGKIRRSARRHRSLAAGVCAERRCCRPGKESGAGAVHDRRYSFCADYATEDSPIQSWPARRAAIAGGASLLQRCETIGHGKAVTLRWIPALHLPARRLHSFSGDNVSGVGTADFQMPPKLIHCRRSIVFSMRGQFVEAEKSSSVLS